jgi:hypothetical protein
MFIHDGKEMCRAIDLVLICPSCRFRTRRPIARSRFLTCGQESHRLARSGMATHKMINPWWRHTIPFPLAAPPSSQRRSSVRNGGNSNRLHDSGMISLSVREKSTGNARRDGGALLYNVSARRLLAMKEPRIAIRGLRCVVGAAGCCPSCCQSRKTDDHSSYPCVSNTPHCSGNGCGPGRIPAMSGSSAPVSRGTFCALRCFVSNRRAVLSRCFCWRASSFCRF